MLVRRLSEEVYARGSGSLRDEGMITPDFDAGIGKQTNRKCQTGLVINWDTYGIDSV